MALILKYSGKLHQDINAAQIWRFSIRRTDLDWEWWDPVLMGRELEETSLIDDACERVKINFWWAFEQDRVGVNCPGVQVGHNCLWLPLKQFGEATWGGFRGQNSLTVFVLCKFGDLWAAEFKFLSSVGLTTTWAAEVWAYLNGRPWFFVLSSRVQIITWMGGWHQMSKHRRGKRRSQRNRTHITIEQTRGRLLEWD